MFDARLAALEAQYTLQAEAFILGMSDFIPQPQDYLLTQTRASEIVHDILVDDEAA